MLIYHPLFNLFIHLHKSAERLFHFLDASLLIELFVQKIYIFIISTWNDRRRKEGKEYALKVVLIKINEEGNFIP